MTTQFAAMMLGVLQWVLLAVVLGTLLALITWLVLGSIGKRLRPAIHGAFWLVVLIKFVLPAGPGWSLSLANLTDPLIDTLSLQGIEEATTASTTSEARIASGPSAAESGVWLWNDPVEEVAAATAPLTAQTWSLSTLLGVAYLSGILIFASVRLEGYRRFAACCRRLPLAAEPIREVVASLCARVGVRRIPKVRISDGVPAPFIIGGLRPTLVLSTRQLCCPKELEAVILHELAHLRRGDWLVRYLQWLAGTVLFFWPVVAWVNRRIDLAREHACDEWALRHAALSAADYARCLLRAVRPMGIAPLAFQPATMAAGRLSVERRIEMLGHIPKRHRRSAVTSVLAVAILAAWSGLVLTSAAVSGQDPKGSNANKLKIGQIVVTNEGQVITKTEPGAVHLLRTEGVHAPESHGQNNPTPRGVPWQDWISILNLEVPDFTFESVDGKRLTKSDILGTPTIFVYLSAVERIFTGKDPKSAVASYAWSQVERYATSTSGVRIVFLLGESPESPRSVGRKDATARLRKLGVQSEIYFDEGRTFALRSYPIYFIVNEEGRFREVLLGVDDPAKNIPVEVEAMLADPDRPKKYSRSVLRSEKIKVDPSLFPNSSEFGHREIDLYPGALRKTAIGYRLLHDGVVYSDAEAVKMWSKLQPTKWSRWVEELAANFNFVEAQQEAARSILSEMENRAARALAKIDFDQRIELPAEQVELYQLFAVLKKRVIALMTAAQKASNPSLLELMANRPPPFAGT